jgi:tRNAThr (cytosine32-N3)-methyltransferase
MKKVADSMKPGSFLFFRDYGRYDFGQLNLSSKGNRKLRDNFYRKNDGVCVYYFLEEELNELCVNSGLVTIKINFHCKLLQNRKTGLKMYRVWIQGRFYKPPLTHFFE